MSSLLGGSGGSNSRGLPDDSKCLRGVETRERLPSSADLHNFIHLHARPIRDQRRDDEEHKCYPPPRADPGWALHMALLRDPAARTRYGRSARSPWISTPGSNAACDTVRSRCGQPPLPAHPCIPCIQLAVVMLARRPLLRATDSHC